MSGFSLSTAFQTVYFLYKSLVDSFLPLVFLGIFIGFIFVMFAFRSKWKSKLQEMM